VVAAVALGGCAEAVDTAKQTFPRSTVPAARDGGEPTGSTGTPKTNDPAFSNDKLIVLDPCALLTDDLLSSLGSPDDNQAEDFGNCANYMTDKDGKDLSITLYVGETISGAEEATENIGGLPALSNPLDDGTACFVSVITSTNPNIGIKVQVGGEGEQLCDVGKTILTSVVDQIREDPPEREKRTGSVADVDPCSLLDSATLAPAIGGVETEVDPYTLHWCNWNGTGVSASVWFRTGYDPKEDTSEPGQPVDLGNGLTAYQYVEGEGSCRAEWMHRSNGGNGDDEIVEVAFEKYEAAGDNGCATAVEVAKLLVPTLPKP
jgi:hypothetical protein